MDQAKEQAPEFAEDNVSIDPIVEKVKVIVRSSHGALLVKWWTVFMNWRSRNTFLRKT